MKKGYDQSATPYKRLLARDEVSEDGEEMAEHRPPEETWESGVDQLPQMAHRY